MVNLLWQWGKQEAEVRKQRPLPQACLACAGWHLGDRLSSIQESSCTMKHKHQTLTLTQSLTLTQTLTLTLTVLDAGEHQATPASRTDVGEH